MRKLILVLLVLMGCDEYQYGVMIKDSYLGDGIRSPRVLRVDDPILLTSKVDSIYTGFTDFGEATGIPVSMIKFVSFEEYYRIKNIPKEIKLYDAGIQQIYRGDVIDLFKITSRDRIEGCQCGSVIGDCKERPDRYNNVCYKIVDLAVKVTGNYQIGSREFRTIIMEDSVEFSNDLNEAMARIVSIEGSEERKKMLEEARSETGTIIRYGDGLARWSEHPKNKNISVIKDIGL